MRNDFLAGARAPFLADLATRRLLVGFDYDGVLAPLVTAPDGRAMRPATARLLREVARRYPVVVVSGRAFRDLCRLVPGRGIVRVGNHGFELGRAVPVPRRVRGLVAGWEAEVVARLDGVPGWHVEHKRSTLSIHYGMGKDWRRVERAVRAAGRRLLGARLLPGKKVLNVIPASFPTKGDAVLRLLSRFRLDVALFLGDDRTDEDVFRIGGPTVVGVRVGAGSDGGAVAHPSPGERGRGARATQGIAPAEAGAVKLLLLRHGPAGDRAAWRRLGKEDFLRPLTADGRARTRAAAKGLSRLLDPPGVIATSPFARAVQTGNLLARAFGIEAPDSLQAIVPGGAPAEVLPWLEVRAGLDLVALVGHEPQLGRLASWLLARSEHPFVELKKAGACLLDLGNHPRAGSARLVWLLAPAQLRRLGR